MSIAEGEVKGSTENLEEASQFQSGVRLSYLAGSIDSSEAPRFKRMVFRISRGNTWTILKDIEPVTDEKGEVKDQIIDPLTGELVKKSVFLIVYQGGASDTLRSKLNRVADSFGASKFGIPEDQQSFNKKLDELERQTLEAQNLKRITRE